MDTIFDVGECGWALYHVAHLNWRKAQGENPPNVTVWTLPDRIRMYQGGKATLIRSDLPYELLYSSLIRNSFLYNNGPPIEDMFKECNIDPESVIHGWKDYDWKNMYWYGDKLKFEPFEVFPQEIENYQYQLKKQLDSTKKNIVIMPRYKTGTSYLQSRNWRGDYWRILCSLLISETDCNLIFCGKYGETFFFNEIKNRTMNLISDMPFPMNLCALNDPNTVLAVSSQSFGGKLALLQNVDTVMWGHQQKRHQEEENWSTDPNTVCHFIYDQDYSCTPDDVFSVIKNHLRIKEEV